MKVIRRKVFETNSSSSHSISVTNWEKPKNEKIPLNSNEFIVKEYGDIYGGEDYIREELVTEVDKLSFSLNVIATYIDHVLDKNATLYPILEYKYDKTDWRSNIYKEDNERRRTFENLIKQNQFVWLKELVEEKTGTKIKFQKPKSEFFPFFETVYDDYHNTEEIFDCDWQDEESFKKYMEELIFNDNKMIKIEENPY